MTTFPTWILNSPQYAEFLDLATHDNNENETVLCVDDYANFMVPDILTDEPLTQVMKCVKYWNAEPLNFCKYIRTKSAEEIRSTQNYEGEREYTDDLIAFATAQKQCLSIVAAKKGSIKWLKYAYNNGYLLDEECFIYAAKHGHLDCLIYVNEHVNYPHTYVIPQAFRCAAKYGHLDCLQYLHKECICDDRQLCDYATQGGHLDCLQYLYEIGYTGHTCDEVTCVYAAQYGRLNCLQYLHERHCPWDKRVCIFAATYGHVDCLQYAHEHGCPWDTYVCSSAATYGHLECLHH